MYKLPKKVRVGPFVYTLFKTTDLDHNGQWGVADHAKREIRFGELCTGRELSITFVHELIHTVAKAYGVSIKEEVCNPLSHGLAQALMGQPDLILLDQARTARITSRPSTRGMPRSSRMRSGWPEAACSIASAPSRAPTTT